MGALDEREELANNEEFQHMWWVVTNHTNGFYDLANFILADRAKREREAYETAWKRGYIAGAEYGNKVGLAGLKWSDVKAALEQAGKP